MVHARRRTIVRSYSQMMASECRVLPHSAHVSAGCSPACLSVWCIRTLGGMRNGQSSVCSQLAGVTWWLPTSCWFDALLTACGTPGYNSTVLNNSSSPCHQYTACLRLGCHSLRAAYVKYMGLCPGAPYTEYLECRVKRRDECSGKCVWTTTVSKQEEKEGGGGSIAGSR
jgi:hypothetical protein